MNPYKSVKLITVCNENLFTPLCGINVVITDKNITKVDISLIYQITNPIIMVSHNIDYFFSFSGKSQDFLDYRGMGIFPKKLPS